MQQAVCAAEVAVVAAAKLVQSHDEETQSEGAQPMWVRLPRERAMRRCDGQSMVRKPSSLDEIKWSYDGIAAQKGGLPAKMVRLELRPGDGASTQKGRGHLQRRMRVKRRHTESLSLRQHASRPMSATSLYCLRHARK